MGVNCAASTLAPEDADGSLTLPRPWLTVALVSPRVAVRTSAGPAPSVINSKPAVPRKTAHDLGFASSASRRERDLRPFPKGHNQEPAETRTLE